MISKTANLSYAVTKSYFTLLTHSYIEVCSDESVYAPGYIQPHGMLLMLQEPQLIILQISENVKQFFGISAEALLGQPLQRLFSSAQVQRLTGYLAEDNLEFCNPFQLKTRRVAQTDGQRKNQTFRGVMHSNSKFSNAYKCSAAFCLLI